MALKRPCRPRIACSTGTSAGHAGGARTCDRTKGYEWLYVLSGRLRLVLGDEDHVLTPGEAAEFSAWTPHWMSGVDGPVEVLALMGHHGERAHLRVRPESP